jgi:3D (Asp-Asp-Asp) domain-containing protein
MTTTTKDIAHARREARRLLRGETAAWQTVALGTFGMSLAVNLSTFGAHELERQAWADRESRYQTQLQHVETIRDHAVQELGVLAAWVSREQQAREEQAAAYEALGDWEYLGEFTITAYCPCEDCCGRWADGVTASGIPAGPGIVAVDRSVIPLGSTVVIDGQRYLAADTGVTGNRVDICMTSHEDTVAHGVRTAEVWVVS